MALSWTSYVPLWRLAFQWAQPRASLDRRTMRAKLAPMERLDDCVILAPGPADADDLARVHIQAWRETYAGLLPGPWLAGMNAKVHARRFWLQLGRGRAGEMMLAVEARSGLVGYCAGAAEEIFTLYLLKKVQRLGLGRRLLASGARILAGQGRPSLRSGC